MREIEELGLCPECDCSIILYKTKSYKRFAKCEICGFSYAIPKRGKIEHSGLVCPETRLPILIIIRKKQKAYFWVDRPCFTCLKRGDCEPLDDLVQEFEDNEIYGYGKATSQI